MSVKMQAVTSSNIAEIGYDVIKAELFVRFLNGSFYRYLNVPDSAWHGLKTANSHGTYLNKVIKPNYQFEQVTAPLDDQNRPSQTTTFQHIASLVLAIARRPALF